LCFGASCEKGDGEGCDGGEVHIGGWVLVIGNLRDGGFVWDMRCARIVMNLRRDDLALFYT